MESGTYFVVHSPYRYGCLALALGALSCGSASKQSGSAGASAGGASAGGASGHAGVANTGHAGTAGHGGMSTAAEAGAAGASEPDGGSAGSVAMGGANSSGAGGGSSGGSGGSAQGGGGASNAPVPDNNLCTKAKVIALAAATPSIDIAATTLGAQHNVDAPCESGGGPDVFYELTFSHRIFVYADTFGASWDTVLYLLKDDCTPLAAPTTGGDSVCNAGACGTSQSQIVALLEPGHYRLGLSGHNGAAGAATIHFQWALAGAGNIAPLPAGSSVQSGSTLSASGSIQNITNDCLALGPENSYWWCSCPSDLGGTLSASTCGGASWETALELELPASAPYACSLDVGCGLQTSLSSAIPAGAGLRVLSVDGQNATDKGSYTMTVSRP